MTDMGLTTKTPWHLWVLGGVSLLWNGFGAFDFVNSAMRGEEYYRQMKMPEQAIAQMQTYPTWMWAVWFVGVFGGLAGSILLLLRRRWTFEVWAASVAAAVISLIYCTFISDMVRTMGVSMIVMPVVIVIIAGLLVWYALAMTKRGVLR